MRMQLQMCCSVGKNAAGMGMERAPLEPEDSIAGMLQVIRGMNPEKSGQFVNHEGETIPY